MRSSLLNLVRRAMGKLEREILRAFSIDWISRIRISPMPRRRLTESEAPSAEFAASPVLAGCGLECGPRRGLRRPSWARR